MEIKSIEAFLVLANCLNFTKSADQVYISQPAFSRQILRLEEEFDCKLFIRNKRTVELTEYGRIFSEYAQRICTEIEKWKLHNKQLHSGESGRLRIGFLNDFPHDFLPRLIQTFASNHPNAEVNCNDMSIKEIIHGVLAGDLDCGISLYLDNEIKKFDQLTSMIVSSVKMCAVLPANHLLANRESLKMEELSKENFITVSAEHTTPGLFHTKFICETAGFEPNIVSQTNFVPSMLMLVKCGIGVAMAAQTAEHISPGGICFVPIDNKYAYADIILFWKKMTKNPMVSFLIRTAKSLL
ncbi:MAG: LysR family transcriptional regulator [Treponema sp.]|jgi:DNA-binding transcriptional LysR family regulator|nr:LysR family transcriptional regulator [Treponema sp.]